MLSNKKLTNTPLTIVLYNYVQPSERNTPGGGVSVYMRNLSSSLRKAGHNVHVLSSGDRYDIFNSRPRLESKNNGEMIIYNSPVIAPAIYSFYHPEIFLGSDLLDTIPTEIKKVLPNVDIFHFHNIEGLTLSFFKVLRAVFTDSTILYSAHNYNIGCSQVNLWRNNAAACKDYHDGVECVNCLDSIDKRNVKLLVGKIKTPIKNLSDHHPLLAAYIYSMDHYTRNILTVYSSNPSASHSRATPGPLNSNNQIRERSALYRAFRVAGNQLMNEVFDCTFAVSKRTASILIGFGAQEARIKTCYIGTKHADRMHKIHRKIATAEDLHIGYFGYMKREKGFYYFLDNLEQMNETDRRCVDVTVAVRFIDDNAVKRMHKIAPSFRTFNIHNGYTHETLDDLLAPVNLGIVPPLWEDNLPQVAIEFVTHGIPILVSNMGGAQEISNCRDFVFDVSEPTGIVRKICAILSGDLDVSLFWRNEPNVRSNEQHMIELINLYRQVSDERRSLPSSGTFATP